MYVYTSHFLLFEDTWVVRPVTSVIRFGYTGRNCIRGVPSVVGLKPLLGGEWKELPKDGDISRDLL